LGKIKGINLRVNNQIRTPKVRLIDTDGKQLGIVTIEEALRIAASKNLDLVEVAPLADPPVCKILDYSHYKYELSKKLKQRKKEKELKIIRIKPFIENRDLEIKVNHIREFLEKGHKVRVEIVCEGYRRPFLEMVEKLLTCVKEKVSDIGTQEYEDRRESGTSILIFAPKKH